VSDPKPIVQTAIVTEFGNLMDDPATFMDEMGMNRDVTYVPGFSDLRRDADLRRGQGKVPAPLPVNLRWVRRTLRDGKPTNERTVVVKGKGYRPVTKMDLQAKPDWFQALPATASILPDGSVGSADMQLMVCDQLHAQRNAAHKLLRWQELNTASEREAIERASTALKGSDAEVTKEPGPTTAR
jgi:hypothetical protein